MIYTFEFIYLGCEFILIKPSPFPELIIFLLFNTTYICFIDIYVYSFLHFYFYYRITWYPLMTIIVILVFFSSFLSSRGQNIKFSWINWYEFPFFSENRCEETNHELDYYNLSTSIPQTTPNIILWLFYVSNSYEQWGINPVNLIVSLNY